jgi:polyphosphate kinase
MTRNLDHRVEAVTPVEATRLRNQLRLVLEVSLTDNRRRWVMQSDGSYGQVTPDDGPARDTQEILMAATDAALERGYGPGMEVDMDLIEAGLLIEPTAIGGVEGDRELSATTADSDGDEEGYPDSGTTSVFDRYAEQWYHPDSETYEWAVRTRDGDRRYFKTRDGARTRLHTEYETPS